ncbi:MAG: tetratricopeptide repeat protein, partial [Chloroflexi bacterium]|nr:tetratricopeptide repeat protein [Chloroflexota bacterium]
MLTPQQRTHLRDLVAQCFSNDELKAFCFEFGLDAEELVPANVVKSVAVRAIILWLENREQLDLLLGWARCERPLADWGDLASLPTPSYDQFDRHTSPLPRMGVLWAAPLIYEKDGQRHPIDLLNVQQERQRLHDSLNEAGHSGGNAVLLREMIATVPNLQKLLSIGCQILHYSGHGAPDFLAFEGEAGMAHALSADALRQLLQVAGATVPKLVFVSACHSRVAGEAFAAAGVAHVVAVRVEQAVLDEAASVFARQFYLALLMGQTVRQAFAQGQQAVLNDYTLGTWGAAADEHDKFLLLPPDADHEQAILANGLRGQWRAEQVPQAACVLPAAPSLFVGRGDDLQKAVAMLHGQRYRLVTLHGMGGIGKTALAVEAARYVYERSAQAKQRFEHGVYFVPTRGLSSKDEVLAAIVDVLAEPLSMKAETLPQLQRALRDKRCLLLIDNLEDVLAGPQRREVRALLQTLLDNCPGLTLCVTSREQLTKLGSWDEGVLLLRGLQPWPAAELFARSLDEATLNKLARELGLTTWGAVLNALAQHPLLGFLAGHPNALRIMAAQVAERRLAEITHEVETRRIAAIRDQRVPADDLDRYTSQVISLDLSWEQLKNPDAGWLLGLMGLLPAGALADDLSAMWGNDDWGGDPIAELRRKALVETRGGASAHYSTVPMVGSYAEAKLSAAQRAGFAERIAQHFAAWVRGLYDGLLHNRVQFGMVNGWLSLHAANVALCFATSRLAVGQPLGDLGYYLGQLAQLSGNATRGLLWLQEADAACQHLLDRGDPQGHAAQANVLKALGDLKVRVADLAGARADYERALPIYRAIEDRLGEANVLQSLGDLKVRVSDLAGARADYERALPIYRAIEDRLGEANILQSLGNLKVRVADLAGARADYERALPIYRAIEDRLGEANVLKALGDLKVRVDDLAGARADYERALPIYRAIEARLGEANTLQSLGDLKVRVADLAGARADYERALPIYRAIE